MGEVETLYEYDDGDPDDPDDSGTGRLVRSRQWRESEWDAEQAGWMLALAQLEREECSGCGQPMAETLDLANEYGYTAAEPWVCAGCAAIDRGQKQWISEGNELTMAHRFVPERR